MKIRVNGSGRVVAYFDEAGRICPSLMRAALQQALNDIQDTAQQQHRYTSRPGGVERSIETRMLSNTVGEVYSLNPVAFFLHEGTGMYGALGKAIVITPRSKSALRWVSGSGFAFAKRVVNPGIKPDPYLTRALETNTPKIINRFTQLLDEL